MDFDYIIIGAGAAGLHLALAMERNKLGKKVLILDPDLKNENDKTYCFWKKEEGPMDSLIKYQWEDGRYFSSEKEISISFEEYSYNLITALDFYNHAKTILTDHPDFTWLPLQVDLINQDVNKVVVSCGEEVFVGSHVFDSRVHESFYSNSQSINLLQHFKGWVIETEEEVFDTQSFTMMDYRLQHEESTSFTYVLPFSSTKALVEFTLFTDKVLENDVYDKHLATYIEKYLTKKPYFIKSQEQGVIPMSNYNFAQHHSKRVTKIGTGGGWVKPSSGYSFKNSEKNAALIVQNINTNQPTTKRLYKKRFFYYDTLFLDILKTNNRQGQALFSSLYTRNPTKLILKFLDEETTFWEELKIMASFKPWPFLKAIVRQIGRKY